MLDPSLLLQFDLQHQRARDRVGERIVRSLMNVPFRANSNERDILTSDIPFLVVGRPEEDVFLGMKLSQKYITATGGPTRIVSFRTQDSWA